MRSVRQYIATIWSHWVSRMSGIFSVVFILVALVFRLTEVGQARYWVVAAILSYILASFLAWRAEKRGSEKLQEIIDSLSQTASDVSLTPKELVSVYEGRTSLQGQKLAAAYIGKWITVSGSVSDVTSITRQVGISLVGVPNVQMYFDAKRWADPISVLRKGDSITVRGRVDGIASYGIRMEDCELIQLHHLAEPQYSQSPKADP